MTYVQTLDTENDSRYNILERDTGLVIVLKTSLNAAQDMAKSLNMGSGFGGFTPPFFTERFAADGVQHS